ncbi:TIGR04255 family protein [Streptomyces erythrochromogenes]|uniref:TIGR04255 family protein n=1 Tax=Streptomyces erythrochromogenes TaxID=285574 RepID=UPI003318C06F
MGGEAVPQRRTYRNPPIVEAICSFTFAPDSPWNPTIPGRVFEQVQDRYPDEPEERTMLQGTVGPDAEAGFSTRIAFRDGSRVMSIGPRSISVHSLAPYEGWESFRHRATEALDAYNKVASGSQIATIGLRYVNRIIIPDTQFNFVDYFTIAQSLPSAGFPGGITSFFDRMEVVYSDTPEKIVFTWASDGDVAGHPAFIMDFDLTRHGEILQSDVPLFLESLRNRERAAFESIIQDKLREAFDADS